jgi:putative transposase
MTTQLTLAALKQAIAERGSQPGLIHHSDRGVQYASYDYVEQLQQIGAQISMSSVSNPYDNAKAESFLRRSSKRKCILRNTNLLPMQRQIWQYSSNRCIITKRLHSSLGYLPPAEFEATYISVPGS